MTEEFPRRPLVIVSFLIDQQIRGPRSPASPSLWNKWSFQSVRLPLVRGDIHTTIWDRRRVEVAFDRPQITRRKMLERMSNVTFVNSIQASDLRSIYLSRQRFNSWPMIFFFLFYLSRVPYRCSFVAPCDSFSWLNLELFHLLVIYNFGNTFVYPNYYHFRFIAVPTSTHRIRSLFINSDIV